MTEVVTALVEWAKMLIGSFASQNNIIAQAIVTMPAIYLLYRLLKKILEILQ